MTLRALYDLPAPAKLNLFLHVVGRRDDGYHLLQSAFVLIDWADTLHLELREADGRLIRRDLGDPLPDDDLCRRAAKALQQASSTRLGADIFIDKRLPSGAGMGGGSSDAATVLLGLNRLWGLNWPRSRLLELGLALGADVPFFLHGSNAIVEGIGEQLTPLDLALSHTRWAVIKPPASLPTAVIFTSPDLKRDTEPAIVAGLLAGDARCQILQGYGRNDLQPVAERHCSEVAQAAALLQRVFGNSRMTGSGSAVFARADQEVGTNDTPKLAMLPELPAGWVGRMCRGLDEHPLRGFAADGQSQVGGASRSPV